MVLHHHRDLSSSDSDDERDDNKRLDKSPDGRYFKLQQKIADKDFSTIDNAHLGFDNESALEVVWNELTYKSGKLNSTKAREDFQSKIRGLIQLDHFNIVKFIDLWNDEDKKQVVFITEKMTGTSGTLKTYVRDIYQSGRSIPEKVGKRWCRQMISAIKFMHTRDPPISHGNLKIGNIFLQHNGVLKVGAVVLGDVRTFVRTVGHGEMNYFPPEYFEEDDEHRELDSMQLKLASDIYALGLCFLEIATGRLPYSECKGRPQRMLGKILSHEPPSEIEHVQIEGFKNLILDCIVPRAEERPTASELMFNPFLFEVPRLSVITGHFIIRNAISLGDNASEEDVEFLNQVKVGVLGTLGNIDWSRAYNIYLSGYSMDRAEKRESRRTLDTKWHVQKHNREVQGIGVQLTLKLQDTVKRKIRFAFWPNRDSAKSVVNDMVLEGLLQVNDKERIVRELITFAQRLGYVAKNDRMYLNGVPAQQKPGLPTTSKKTPPKKFE